MNDKEKNEEKPAKSDEGLPSIQPPSRSSRDTNYSSTEQNGQSSTRRLLEDLSEDKQKKPEASGSKKRSKKGDGVELGVFGARSPDNEQTVPHHTVGAFAVQGDRVEHRDIPVTEGTSTIATDPDSGVAVAAQIADSQVQEEVRRALGGGGGGGDADGDIHAQLDAHVRRILAESAVEAAAVQPIDDEESALVETDSEDEEEKTFGEETPWYKRRSTLLLCALLLLIAVVLAVAIPLATKDSGSASSTSTGSGGTRPTEPGTSPRNETTAPGTPPPNETPNETTAPSTLPPGETAMPTTTPPTTSPTPEPTFAPEWEKLGPSINGLAANGAFGLSLSLAQKGTIVAAGSPQSNGATGYAAVYSYNSNANTWRQRGQILNGRSGSFFGWSVSLSDLGDVVAVGADYVDEGFVRLYQFNESSFSWIQKGADLLGLVKGDRFGSTVELSGDGSTLAVAAMGNSSGYVAVYRFDDAEDKWTQVGDYMDTSTAGDFLGFALSLSETGNTLAVGSHERDAQGSGEVVVYQLDEASGSWTSVGDKFTGDAPLDRFGASVSLSSNGGVLAVGAPSESPSLSYVRVYELMSGKWQQRGSDLQSVLPNEEFGKSVSLSGDASRLAVGSRFHGFSGYHSGMTQVFEYDQTSMSWSRIGQNIYGENGQDESGFAVSMSGDGDVVAVSSHLNDEDGEDSGQIRIFKLFD